MNRRFGIGGRLSVRKSVGLVDNLCQTSVNAVEEAAREKDFMRSAADCALCVVGRGSSSKTGSRVGLGIPCDKREASGRARRTDERTRQHQKVHPGANR